MINETLEAKGKVHIVVRDENGVVKEERNIDNLIVSVGKAFIASRMIGTSSSVMSHMEIGQSSTAAAAGQTALQSAFGTPARVSLSGSTQTTVTVTNDSVLYTATFPSGTGTGSVQEAGIFNASSSGTMLCRTVFSAINKGASDSMTINWTVTIG